MEYSEPQGRTVTPRVIGDNVVCRCGSLMFPVVYEALEEPERRATWIYWACFRDGGEVSCAIPLPPSLKITTPT